MLDIMQSSVASETPESFFWQLKSSSEIWNRADDFKALNDLANRHRNCLLGD